MSAAAQQPPSLGLCGAGFALLKLGDTGDEGLRAEALDAAESISRRSFKHSVVVQLLLLICAVPL